MTEKWTGLLTLPLRGNYGGILQAYALKTILERMGARVVLLDRKQRHFPTMMTLLKRMVKRYLLGRKEVVVLWEYIQYNEYKRKSGEIRRFIHTAFPEKISVWKMGNLPLKSLDTIVVGSDQVWRPCYTPDLQDAYLGFVKDRPIRRIAYAASFGSEEKEYTPRQIAQCRPLLRRFDAVSVRENSGVALCRDYFGVESEWVLDPTLLLEVSCYRSLIGARKNERQGGVFAYILDETAEKEEWVRLLSEKYGGERIVAATSRSGNPQPSSDEMFPAVEDWLASFDAAHCVITDSFHGCVFSILFHKDFFVVVNSERGASRFHALLSLFHLENRKISSEQQILKLRQDPIAWDAVDEILSQQKEKSLSYLLQALKP